MLTAKQEKYVQNLVKGLSQREAYRKAYPSSLKWKDNIVDSKASNLFKNGKVLARYNELIDKADDEAIMSAKERMIWLTNVIKGNVTHTSYDSNGNAYDNEAYISDKLKAVDVLNKMSGEYIQDIRLSGSKDNPLVAQISTIDSVAKQLLDVNEDDIDVGINS